MIALIKFNIVSGHFGSRCESGTVSSATVISAEEHARFAAASCSHWGAGFISAKNYGPAKLSGKAFFDGQGLSRETCTLKNKVF